MTAKLAPGSDAVAPLPDSTADLPPELLVKLASLGAPAQPASSKASGASAKQAAMPGPLIQELDAAPPPPPAAAFKLASAAEEKHAAYTLAVEPPQESTAGGGHPHGCLVVTTHLFDVASVAQVALEVRVCVDAVMQ